MDKLKYKNIEEQREEYENLKLYVPTEEEAKDILTAEKYPEFLSMKETTKEMKEVLGNYDENFRERMDNVLEQLENSVNLLELSQKNQEEYGLVDKRWMREPDFIRKALEKGRLVMELDLRIDKDGEFWISHATGAKASFAPPFIHEMTTEEMEEKGRRFSLQEAFQIFSEYNDGKHKLILEIKTLGGKESDFENNIDYLMELISKNNLENVIAISSLSPGILMTIHKNMPKIPLILNGGIVPGFSYERTKEEQNFAENLAAGIMSKIIPSDKKWRAFGLELPIFKKVFEVVVSSSEESVIRPDGEGVQTGYVLASLPKDLTNVLLEQKKAKKELGGMTSLSAVTILASVLDMVGAKESAEKMRKYYNDVIEKLEIGKMVTTWGQGLSKIPIIGETLFRRLKPEEQIKVFKKELGPDVLIYTKGPEEFAHKLPDFATTYGE